MTVYENIFLGNEIHKGMLVDWNETIKRAGEMLKKVSLDVNPATKVKDLGVGKQQLVEIAKALSKDVKLLILDEPTAALNEDDSENLLEPAARPQDQGVTCDHDLAQAARSDRDCRYGHCACATARRSARWMPTKAKCLKTC